MPQADVELAFTHTEIELLERLVHDTPQNAQAPPIVRNVIRITRYRQHLTDDVQRRTTAAAG